MTSTDIENFGELFKQFGDNDILEILGENRLKLNRENWLAIIWNVCMGLSFLALLIFGVVRCNTSAASASIGWWLGGSFLFFAILRVLTKSYYVIELGEDKVVYHHQFLFFFQGEKVVLEFRDIAGLAVGSKRIVGPSFFTDGIHWEYAAVLITNRGEQLRISDFRKKKYLPFFNKFVTRLGELLQTNIYPNDGEIFLKVEWNHQEKTVKVYNKPYSMWTDMSYLTAIAIIVGVVLGLYLYYSFMG